MGAGPLRVFARLPLERDRLIAAEGTQMGELQMGGGQQGRKHFRRQTAKTLDRDFDRIFNVAWF